jgi:2'-5' RNA ligase
MTMAKIRAFLAVNLSVPTIRAVTEYQQALRKETPRELRVAWVNPASMHLTVKFLGPIEPEAVEAIADTLARGLVTAQPFEVRVQGAGAFPTAERPRVLWVGVEDPQGGLATLARDVEGWMEELGFAREERAFSPHLTLGRVKEGHAPIDALLGAAATKQFGATVLREIVLYESRLARAGAEYIALKRVPFGSRSPERPVDRAAERPQPSGAPAAPAPAEAPSGPDNPKDTEKNGNGA